nr:PH domain-containing protein [Nocardiopsis ansamitocini]
MRPAPPPRPTVDLTRGSHRLHLATVALHAAVVALVFLALPAPFLLGVGSAWTPLLLTVAVGLAAGAYSLVAWWNTVFGLKEDHLVLHSGLFRRVTREIPLSRLQAVDVVRPLFIQVLGLAELRVELAGGDSSEIRLRYLGREPAERLRASMLAHAAGLSGGTPEAPETPFYKLPFSLLIGALAFRIPVLLSFTAFLVLIVAGMAFGEVGVLGGAVPLLLGLMRGMLGPLFRYVDFYASLSPDGLRLRYGVFQARMQTVPPGRVQALRIVEPLLWRFLGVVRVEANVAGYAGERQMDSSTLLPVVPKELAYALVKEVFPGAGVSSVPVHPAARGRFTKEVLGVGDRVFVSGRGRFCRVVEIVPHSRMHTLRLTMGPLGRRLGVATVEVDTPPGPVRARAPHRDLAEARRVIDGIADRADRARADVGGPERWATRSDIRTDPDM